MEQHMPITTTRCSRKDEELDLPDLSIPPQNLHLRNNVTQYVLPNCYGKGKRLCDFEVPSIPKSCFHLLKEGKRKPKENAAFILKGAQGRGRAVGSTVTPAGLQTYVSGVQSDVNEEVEDKQSHPINIKKEQASPPPSPPLCWTLLPPHVCQIDGLPVEFDQEILADVVSFYSSIVDKEELRHNELLSIRYKLTSTDACDLLSSSLNDTDLFGTGKQVFCRYVTS